MFGIFALIPQPTSLTSMSGASVAKSTASKPIRLSIQFAALDIASVLLAKTFHSSTFKLALIAIGVFGIIVCAIFSYVYLSTASYIRSRSDRAIIADYASLLEAYHRAGGDGGVPAIHQRVADKQFKDSVYMLADSSFAFLSGTSQTWTPSESAH